MTMSHVAARTTAPADNAVARVRDATAKGRPDEMGDADFGKHIEGFAAGRDPAGRAAPPIKRDLEPRATRWQPLKDSGPQVSLPDEPPAADVEMLAAADPLLVEKPSDAAAPPLSFTPAALPALPPDVLASDFAAAAASVATGAGSPILPTASQQHVPVGTDGLPRLSRAPGPIEADLPAVGIDKPRVPDDLPRVELPTEAHEIPSASVETTRRALDVVVVARETHLPPVAPPLATRVMPAGGSDADRLRGDSAAVEPDAKSGRVVMAETVARTTGAVTLAPVAQSRRSNQDAGRDATSSGQRSTSTMPGRSSPPDAAQPARVQPQAQIQVQAQTQAGTQSKGAEPSFDPAQPAQTVRSPAQDEHPAPQATVPVPRQIVDGIAAEIPPPQDKSPAGPAAAPAPSTQSQPVKVVTIQLNPAELGTLTVRISLRNDTLELQVETSRRETAHMVDADRETLSSLLRSAGYHVEAVTVRAVEQPAPAMAAGTAAGSPDGAPQSQSQSGGSQTDQRPSGGRAHADGRREGHGTRQDTRGDESGSRHRAGRGLYV
jgi:chemotaxis protein MotD